MGSMIIRTDDGRTYQKPGLRKRAAGVAAAYSAALAAIYLATPLNKKNHEKFLEAAKNVQPDEIKQGLQAALKLSGLDKKVKIVDMADKTAVFDMSVFLPRIIRNNKFFRGIYEQLDITGSIKKGKNANFSNVANKIFINTEKLGVAGFHEIGHAINFNKSKFWKFMQMARGPFMSLSAWCMLIAIWKRKKAEGEEPKGFVDKAATFIKNNAGKIALAASLPVVAEELMATKRGNLLAKKILSPDAAKKVARINRFGAMSYISSAAVVAGLAFVCGKVRDAIASPKEIVRNE